MGCGHHRPIGGFVAAFPHTPVVLMSGLTSAADVTAVVRAAARGFLPKTMAPDPFAAVLSMIVDGGTYVPADISANPGVRSASAGGAGARPGRSDAARAAGAVEAHHRRAQQGDRPRPRPCRGYDQAACASDPEEDRRAQSIRGGVYRDPGRVDLTRGRRGEVAQGHSVI
jgi:hypothetical protein